MSAERADSLKILEDEIKENPFFRIFIDCLKKHGGNPLDGIIVTEGMTEEEERMQCIEKLLQKGMTLQEAEKKCEEFLTKIKLIESLLDGDKMIS